MRILGRDFAEQQPLTFWISMLFFGAIIACALFAWKGFVFITIVMWLYLATKDPVNRFVKHPRIYFKLKPSVRWTRLSSWEREYTIDYVLPTSEAWTRRLVSFGITLFTFVALPVAGTSLWLYGQQVTVNVIETSPLLLAGLNDLVSLGNEHLPKYIPNVDLTNDQGMRQFLAQIGGQLVGSSVEDAKALAKTASLGIAAAVAKVLLLWIEVIIMAIILNLFFRYGQVMIELYRAVIKGSSQDEGTKENLIAISEKVQEMMTGFFVGWMKIASVLIVLLLITLSVFPLNISLAQVIFLGVALGLLTSIFKVGGLAATVLGTLLMIFDLKAGFGWWWLPDTFNFTLGFLFLDWFVKVVLMFMAVKSKGLVESYYLTPAIIAEQLDIPKVFIIIAVIPTTLGAGLVGMAVGLNFMFVLFACIHRAMEQGEYPDLKVFFKKITQAEQAVVDKLNAPTKTAPASA